jgi:hypothetical protein
MELVKPKVSVTKWKNEKPQDQTIKWSKDLKEHLKNKPSGYVVFGKEMSGFRNRIYGLAPFDVFFDRYAQLNPVHRRYHEQFQDDEPMRFFLDIEAPKYENNFGSDIDFIEDIVEKIIIPTTINMFENVFYWVGFKGTVDLDDFIIQTAFADNKYSIHMNSSSIYFVNRRHLNYFSRDLYYNCNLAVEDAYNRGNSLIKTLDIRKNGFIKPLFDFSLFGSLRMYGSTNFTETRPFKYWNSDKRRIESEFNPEILKRTCITYAPPDTEKILVEYDRIYAPIDNSKYKSTHEQKEDDFYTVFDVRHYELIKSGILIAKRIYKECNIPFDGCIKKIKKNHEGTRLLFPLGMNICPMKYSRSKEGHTTPTGLVLIVDLDRRNAMIFCKKEVANREESNKKKKKVTNAEGPIRTSCIFNLTNTEYELLIAANH